LKKIIVALAILAMFIAGYIGFDVYKKYKVERHNSIQIETDTITGVKMEGSISWKSDCEYELTYTKVSEPKYAKAIGQKLKVEIIKISGNTVLCKTEGGGITLEIEMIKTD